MSLYGFIEYLKYKWKAKGRHGTHSPFVYDLIDNVLLDKGPLKKQYNINCPALELKYENLLSRIAAYYDYNAIAYLAVAEALNSQVDMLLINGDPATWVALLEQNIPSLKNESMVVVTGIHDSPACTVAWKKLAVYPNVRMSIDLYGIGFLLFKQEFKVKQHFILKY